MSLTQVLKEFPSELRTPVRHLYETIREDQQTVPHEDFSQLKAAVSGLAESHASLAEAVQNLATAQGRTETRVEELAAAQGRTETRIEELALAQGRTETRIEELAAAQAHTDKTMEQGFRKVFDSIAALGSRWGIMSEETFRNTVNGVLAETGYTVERGYYGDREVDIIIKNGTCILLEITSSMKKTDIDKIILSAEDFEVKTGRPIEAMVAAIFIPPRVMRDLLDARRPIRLFTYDDE